MVYSAMDQISMLQTDYPWIQTPLVVGAPMRLISLAKLAVAVSARGGIGFIGAGTDTADLESHLKQAKELLARNATLPTVKSTLPLGIGFINWGASLSQAVPLIRTYRPAAVWFFSPSSTASLIEWADSVRAASPETKIWVQIGSVADAVDAVTNIKPDVLVVQGADAGGHGLVKGAGIVALVPEVMDTIRALTEREKTEMPVVIAAGGIIDGRGAAAALALGAAGVVLGTRLLASEEAVLAKGYQREVLRTTDGGQTTVRTKVYDTLRGTTGWSEAWNARGIVNRSFVDAVKGMDDEENKKLYAEEIDKGDAGWGVEGRMTTYAGSAVGLVNKVQGAGEIVREVREGTLAVLEGLSAKV